jgi:mono/diheme cytochrome c family protein
MHRAVLASGVTVVLVALVAACSSGSVSSGGGSVSGPAPRGAARHDPVLVEGRHLFAQNCARCHGDSGQGGVGPSLQHGKLQRDFPNVDTQVAFVKHGKGIMPAWNGLLSSGQITAVVRYEREVLSAG